MGDYNTLTIKDRIHRAKLQRRDFGLDRTQIGDREMEDEAVFRAGIKEVLEFIPLQEYLKHCELIEDVPIWVGINWKETQAKLKEWGITP